MENNKIADNNSQRILNDTIGIASGIGTLISVPSYLLLYSKLNREQLIIVGGFALFAFFAFAIRFLILRKKQSVVTKSADYVALGSNKDGEFQKNWFYNNHHSILDFVDDNGSEVKCVVEIELKCLIPCRKFYHRVGPADKVSNLESFGGVISSKLHVADYIEFVVDFSKDVVLGEIIHLKLSYMLTNSFLNKREYWKVKKYYAGTNYKITAMLPSNRPARGIDASIVPSEDIMRRVNTMECIKYTFIDNRPVIEVLEDKGKLKANDELLLEWDW